MQCLRTQCFTSSEVYQLPAGTVLKDRYQNIDEFIEGFIVKGKFEASAVLKIGDNDDHMRGISVTGYDTEQDFIDDSNKEFIENGIENYSNDWFEDHKSKGFFETLFRSRLFIPIIIAFVLMAISLITLIIIFNNNSYLSKSPDMNDASASDNGSAEVLLISGYDDAKNFDAWAHENNIVIFDNAVIRYIEDLNMNMNMICFENASYTVMFSAKGNDVERYVDKKVGGTARIVSQTHDDGSVEMIFYITDIYETN